MSIRSLAAIAALTCVSFFAVAAAMAQDDAQPGRGRGGRGGPGGAPGGGGGFGGGGFGGPGGGLVASIDSTMVRIVRDDKVQTELEVMPDQKAALQKLADAPRPERPNFDFQSASDEERTKFMDKMAADNAKRTAEQKDQLTEVLLPAQLERLEQIAIQWMGTGGLASPDLAAKLSLSSEQTDKIKAEVSSVREKMMAMFSGGGGGDRDGMREKFTELRKTQETSMLAVLTDTQKSKFEKLKGKPVEFDLASLASGRGGFGGGGPGGPQGGPGGPGGPRGQGGAPGGNRPARPAAE